MKVTINITLELPHQVTAKNKSGKEVTITIDDQFVNCEKVSAFLESAIVNKLRQVIYGLNNDCSLSDYLNKSRKGKTLSVDKLAEKALKLTQEQRLDLAKRLGLL